MTDQTDAAPTTVTVPSLTTAIINALGTKALTAAATALVGYGILPNDKTTQFVSVGLGLLMGIVSVGITALKERINHQRLAEAVAAPAAVAMNHVGDVLAVPGGQ